MESRVPTVFADILLDAPSLKPTEKCEYSRLSLVAILLFKYMEVIKKPPTTVLTAGTHSDEQLP